MNHLMRTDRAAARVRTAVFSAVLSLTLAACGGSSPQPPAPPETAESEKAQKTVDPRYTALPTPSEVKKWAPPPVDRSKLENGLTLWHLEQDLAPLVSILLVLPLGTASDPEGKEGLTLLTADMLDEGAGKYSALELSEELGRLATSYHARTTVDYVVLQMNALAENLEPSVELLSTIARKPRLPKEEFDRRQKHHLAELLADRDDPRSRVDVALHRVLFQDGYAGAPERGTEKSLRNIRLSDVVARAKKLAVPEGAHLVVAGDVSSDRVEGAAHEGFDSWKGSSDQDEVAVQPALPAETAYIMDFPGAAQSSLIVARRAGDAQDPNYFAEKVMNEKIGGTFVSRINMNLREDKGYTYGAFTNFQRYVNAGYFAAHTSVRSDVTAASVKEIFAELRAVCDQRPLSARDLEESVEGLLLGYPMRFDRIDQVGLRVASLPMYERPADFWATWPSEVSAITLEKANQVAQPYCDTSKYRVVVAGDLAQVKPGFEKLGLEVVELDKEGFVRKPTDAPSQ